MNWRGPLRGLPSFLLLFGLLAACGGGAGPNVSAPEEPLQVDILSSGVYRERYRFQRLRLAQPGKLPTYAIWFEPAVINSRAKAPAVLIADPYSGIDWTGEGVDTDAARRAGTQDFVMIEDLHDPYYDPREPGYAPYDHADLEHAGGSAIAFLLNGFAVIISFERFYAGGSLQNDIDDTLAALQFVKSRPQVDARRIGVWGSSYGASLVLFATAQAKAAWMPAYGALLGPIADFEMFVSYADWLGAVHANPGGARLRLGAFRNRALAAATDATGNVDLARYAAPATLEPKFLFVHDSFDTIAPMLHAAGLYYGTPGKHQVFVYPHQGMNIDWQNFDITHAPVQPGFDQASALLWSMTYLLTRLSPSSGELLVPLFPGFDTALFGHLREQRRLGFSLRETLLPRLLDLCDPRVQLVRFEDDFATRESGCRFVARMLHEHWQIDIDEEDVARRLPDIEF